jgi:hypothetical protein
MQSATPRPRAARNVMASFVCGSGDSFVGIYPTDDKNSSRDEGSRLYCSRCTNLSEYEQKARRPLGQDQCADDLVDSVGDQCADTVDSVGSAHDVRPVLGWSA